MIVGKMNIRSASNDTSRGVSTVVAGFPDLQKRNRPKRKRGGQGRRKQTVEEKTNLMIERKLNKTRVVKYLDVDLLAAAMTTTVANVLITLIPQGDAQGQRIADTAYIDRIDLRLNVVTANADIFNLARVAFFIWKQNSLSVAPNPNSVFENTSTYGPYSMLNFEGRGYYSVLRDLTFNCTGLASAPTTNSQHFYTDSIPLTKHRVDFNSGATSGVGHIYMQYYSDSGVAPWPDINFVARVWYFDD